MNPYTNIAPFYDILMQDIDYEGWVEYISLLLNSFGQKPKSLLDLACGTGTCSILFAQQGLEVIGLDSSEAMLEEAEKKIKKEGLSINLIKKDMRDFCLEKKVELVTCFYDSLNYLLEEEDLLKTFKNVLMCLTDKGFFIFDLNTEYALAHSWGDKVYVRKNDGITSIWKNSYDRKTKIATLELTLFVDQDDHYSRVVEIHKERAYSNGEIKRLLKMAGFSEIHFYRHMTFQKPDSYTNRIMGVARK